MLRDRFYHDIAHKILTGLFDDFFTGGKPKNLEIFQNADAEVKKRVTVFRGVSTACSYLN